MTLLTWSLASLAAAYVSLAPAWPFFSVGFSISPIAVSLHLAQTGMSRGEELRLTTTDGETLVAWYFPAKDGRPLILYFHGNAGALIDRVPRFRMLTARGYGLLAVSYRGYGGSTGSPTQSGLMQDGEAAYREACARGYDGNRIVLMGASLGTGVAIALAATHEAAALVLEAPYLSALDIASAHYPYFPVRWLMLDRFRSDLAIRSRPCSGSHGSWRGRRRHSDKFGQAALRTRQRAENFHERARRRTHRSGPGGCLSARVRMDRH